VPLPIGQYNLGYMPRFGLPQFAKRFPKQTSKATLYIGGDVEVPKSITDELKKLPHVEQASDFHCVTSWSCQNVIWEGIRFCDIYEQLVVPLIKPSLSANTVVFHGQDSYRARMQLEDLLASDVLLADRMNGDRISIENGAPHRLIAPAHYGFKSVKHLEKLEFHQFGMGYTPPKLRFLEHPRARVQYGERGTGMPGWFLRYFYRTLIPSTARKFEAALEQHQSREKNR